MRRLMSSDKNQRSVASTVKFTNVFHLKFFSQADLEKIALTVLRTLNNCISATDSTTSIF